MRRFHGANQQDPQEELKISRMSEEGTIRKNETRNNFVPAKLLNIQSEGGDTVD
jgi:hypothetical protein